MSEQSAAATDLARLSESIKGDALTKAREAAEEVLRQGGAKATISRLQIKLLSGGKCGDDCHCIDSENVCTTTMVWDQADQTYKEQVNCYTRCNQYQCDA